MLKDTKANKVFLIILVVLLAFGFTLTRGWNVRNRTIRANQNIEFAPSDSLNVSSISNDIVIEVDNAKKNASISIGTNESDILSVSKTGKDLNVNVKTKKRGFFQFFPKSSSALVVTLPSSVLDKLDLSSISGSIRILHPIQGNSIVVRSTSGEVDFLTLEGSERVKLTAISGTISGSEAASKNSVEILSTSGSIEVQNVEAKEIILKSVSSSIETDAKIIDGGSLQASSTSGNVEIDLRQSGNLSILASSTSGEVVFNDKEMGKRATTETGQAQTDVKLSSVSGNISLSY